MKALEKLVEAGVELPAFSTLDHMASTVRAEVNVGICAGICAGIWERIGEGHQAGLLRLLDVDALVPGAKSPFNRLKQHAQLVEVEGDGAGPVVGGDATRQVTGPGSSQARRGATDRAVVRHTGRAELEQAFERAN
jgi:hypothetical protein